MNKTLLQVVIGTAFGIFLFVEGVLVFVSGIGQPGVGHFATAYGDVGGNLPLVLGSILILAGIGIAGGAIAFGLRTLEGGDSSPPED